jgi:hypothetical protein
VAPLGVERLGELLAFSLGQRREALLEVLS